ncbi:MAG: hypothetical protein ACK5ZG_08940 [Phycisphaerae bacterium]
MRLRSFIHLSNPTRLLAREERERLEVATRRSLRRRVWSGLIACGVAAAAALLFAYWLAVRTHWRLWDSTGSVMDILDDLRSDDAGEYALAGIGGAMMFVAAAISFAVLAAKRRYVRLLRDRAACPVCGHGLGGLSLDESKHVRCPECEGSMYAVTAWNERGVDASGREVFVPATGLVRVWVSQRVVVRTGKWVGAVVALVLVVYGAWWGVREVGMRRDATLAATDHARYIGEYKRAIGAKSQDEVTDAGFWAEAERIAAGRKASIEAATVQARTRWGPEVEIHENALRRTGSDNEPLTDADIASRDATLAWFMQARGEEWFLAIDALQGRDTTPVWTAETQDGLMPFSVTSFARHVSLPQQARMHLARPSEIGELSSSVRVNLSLADAVDRYDLSITRLVASAVRAMTAERVIASLSLAWSADELAQMQAACEASPPGTLDRVLAGEESWIRASVAEHFSDVARVRQGVEGTAYADEDIKLMQTMVFGHVESGKRKRLGRYKENVAALDAMLEEVTASSRLTHVERLKRGASVVAGEQELVLVEPLRPAIEFVMEQSDAMRSLHELVVTAIALERYRLEHGGYPQRLDVLVPGYLNVIPMDAIDGQPLRYRGERDTYTLWSIGLNGVDDGGVWNARYAPRSAAAAAKHDMVVTSPERAR